MPHYSSRSPGEGNGNPLQYSCLENPLVGGAWQATVHGVAKSRTRLSDFTFYFLLLFYLVWLKLQIIGRKTREVSVIFVIYCQAYILSVWFVTADVGLSRLAEAVVWFLYCFSFPPFTYCTLWKGVTLVNHPQRVGNYLPPPWLPT